MSVTEEVTDPRGTKRRDSNVYLDNPNDGLERFEVITKSQGIPKRWRTRSNLDDCANVANISTELMFADMGHGLLLMGIRFTIQIQRTRGTLSRWGMLHCNVWCSRQQLRVFSKEKRLVSILDHMGQPFEGSVT